MRAGSRLLLVGALLWMACDSEKGKPEQAGPEVQATSEAPQTKAAEGAAEAATKPSLPTVKDAAWAELCSREVSEVVAPAMAPKAARAHLKSKLASEDPALTALVEAFLDLHWEYQAPRFRAEAMRAGQATCPLVDYLELVQLTSACAYQGERESCMRTAFHIEARGATKSEFASALALACVHGVLEGCMSRSTLGKKAKWLARSCSRGRSCDWKERGTTVYDAAITTPFADAALATRFDDLYLHGVRDCMRETALKTSDQLTINFELVDGRPTQVAATSKKRELNECIEQEAPQWAFGASAAPGPQTAVLELSSTVDEIQAILDNSALVETLTGGEGRFPKMINDEDQGKHLDRALKNVTTGRGR